MGSTLLDRKPYSSHSRNILVPVWTNLEIADKRSFVLSSPIKNSIHLGTRYGLQSDLLTMFCSLLWLKWKLSPLEILKPSRRGSKHTQPLLSWPHCYQIFLFISCNGHGPSYLHYLWLLDILEIFTKEGGLLPFLACNPMAAKASQRTGGNNIPTQWAKKPIIWTLWVGTSILQVL